MVEGGGPAGSQDAEQNENASSVVNGSREGVGPSDPRLNSLRRGLLLAFESS